VVNAAVEAVSIVVNARPISKIFEEGDADRTSTLRTRSKFATFASQRWCFRGGSSPELIEQDDLRSRDAPRERVREAAGFRRVGARRM